MALVARNTEEPRIQEWRQKDFEPPAATIANMRRTRYGLGQGYEDRSRVTDRSLVVGFDTVE